MKKIPFTCLIAFLCLCCLTSCSIFSHVENQWFSADKLNECIVSDMPRLNCDCVKENDEIIYANLTEAEFDDYLNGLYSYLRSKEFKYLGTRGEIASSLAGAFTSYYFEPATELAEFKISDGTYKFVYSDGQISMSYDDVSDEFTFCILTVERYSADQTVEYGTKNFDYNVRISLRFNSEFPLGGRYVLKDEHKHTYEEYRDENGHSRSYTCGCDTPSNFEKHYDLDADGKCDCCGYGTVECASMHELAAWLSDLSGENVTEIKTTVKYIGTPPGSFQKVYRTTDKNVIAEMVSDFADISCKSVAREEALVDGGSALTAEFILTDGTVKELSFGNGFYAHETSRDGISSLRYFKASAIPTLVNQENVTVSYRFVTHVETGKVYGGGRLLCEIPLSVIEFTELNDEASGTFSQEKYYIETEFGRLAFFSDTVFYIDYPLSGHTDFYRLVGKTVEDLIAEFGTDAE